VKSPSFEQVGPKAGYHMVRESSWYALGLLPRDETGDRQRAAEILDTVLKQQYVTPGVRWYGTFRRAPEEPDPALDAVIWGNYDPISCSFPMPPGYRSAILRTIQSSAYYRWTLPFEQATRFCGIRLNRRLTFNYGWDILIQFCTKTVKLNPYTSV